MNLWVLYLSARLSYHYLENNFERKKRGSFRKDLQFDHLKNSIVVHETAVPPPMRLIQLHECDVPCDLLLEQRLLTRIVWHFLRKTMRHFSIASDT